MSLEAVFSTSSAVEAFESARLGETYPGPVEHLAFSPDGTWLACATHRRLYLWEVAEQRLVLEQARLVRDLAFHPDGQILAVAGQNVEFLELPGGEKQAALRSSPQGTTCIAYDPTGNLLASGSSDGMVQIGDLATRRLAHHLEHDAPVQALAYSPDGRSLAAICWGEESVTPQVYLWDLESGDKRSQRCNKNDKNLHFSLDSRWLSVDGIIYTVEALQATYDLKEREAIFSPDGSLIVSRRPDFTTIGLWDAASGSKLGVLKGHEDPIWSIAFSPDGRLLASGSGAFSLNAQDLSVRLWTPPAPEAQVEESTAPRQRKPLKRLDAADDDDEDDGNLLTGFLNRLSR